PIADFAVMPALALGALLEPFGLGWPFLWAAGQGIAATLGIGGWVAGLPGAVRTVASAPEAALPVAFLGVLFCCLWRGPLRWLGLPFACAVLLWPRPPTPDLWIGEGGAQAAFRRGGEAVVVRPGVRQFAVDVWSRRRGLRAEPRPREGWVCTRVACAPDQPDDGPVALWWGRRPPTAEQIQDLCRAAAVVAVRAEVADLPPACGGRLVLDGADWARGGGVELWREHSAGPDRWRARWVADARGDRPWSRIAAAAPPG